MDASMASDRGSGAAANDTARHSISTFSTDSTMSDTSTTTPAHAGATDKNAESSKFMPLKTAPTTDSTNRSGTLSRGSSSARNEADLFNVLSRRRTSATGKSDAEVEEEHAEIERLMSRSTYPI